MTTSLQCAAAIKRTILALAALVALAAPALAQQVQPQEYVLTVTPKDVATIARAVDALPFDDEVAALIMKLQRQLDAQDNAPKGGAVK
jgi:hypothetical protein